MGNDIKKQKYEKEKIYLYHSDAVVEGPIGNDCPTILELHFNLYRFESHSLPTNKGPQITSAIPHHAIVSNVGG